MSQHDYAQLEEQPGGGPLVSFQERRGSSVSLDATLEPGRNEAPNGETGSRSRAGSINDQDEGRPHWITHDEFEGLTNRKHHLDYQLYLRSLVFFTAFLLILSVAVYAWGALSKFYHAKGRIVNDLIIALLSYGFLCVAAEITPCSVTFRIKALMVYFAFGVLAQIAMLGTGAYYCYAVVGKLDKYCHVSAHMCSATFVYKILGVVTSVFFLLVWTVMMLYYTHYVCCVIVAGCMTDEEVAKSIEAVPLLPFIRKMAINFTLRFKEIRRYLHGQTGCRLEHVFWCSRYCLETNEGSDKCFLFRVLCWIVLAYAVFPLTVLIFIFTPTTIFSLKVGAKCNSYILQIVLFIVTSPVPFLIWYWLWGHLICPWDPAALQQRYHSVEYMRVQCFFWNLRFIGGLNMNLYHYAP